MSAVLWSSAERFISLPRRLDIANAGELHRVACAALQDGGPLEVDAAQVAEIDTSALQILAALWIAAAGAGVSCRWRGSVSPTLRRGARLIGLHACLRLDTAERTKDGT